MKKILYLLFTSIIAISIMSTTAFAGTTLKSTQNTALAKLNDACGYYGWCTNEKKASSSKTTIVNSFRGTILYSGKVYSAKFRVKTKKKTNRYSTAYYVNEKKYSLISIKKMLKKYSSKVGRASTTKKSTIDIADEIIAFAQKYHWTVKNIGRIEQTNKYVQTIKFSNESYVWKTEITTIRDSKNKKLVVYYTRDDKKSNKPSIKDWLKRYAV